MDHAKICCICEFNIYVIILNKFYSNLYHILVFVIEMLWAL